MHVTCYMVQHFFTMYRFIFRFTVKAILMDFWTMDHNGLTCISSTKIEDRSGARSQQAFHGDIPPLWYYKQSLIFHLTFPCPRWCSLIHVFYPLSHYDLSTLEWLRKPGIVHLNSAAIHSQWPVHFEHWFYHLQHAHSIYQNLSVFLL